MSSHDDPTPDEPPHDVLAAEEFGMGTGDPALHVEPVHDVLAAEEFGMGVGDARLRPAPVTLPEEAAGRSPEPRDVLAAEEFAVPAGRQRRGASGAASEAVSTVARETRRRPRLFGAVVAALTGAVALRWRRRH